MKKTKLKKAKTKKSKTAFAKTQLAKHAKSTPVPKGKGIVSAVTKKIRVGIFGGSFDPFHLGHLNSMTSVAETLKLKKIRVIPAHQTPLRKMVQGSTPEQRLEMTRLGISEHLKLLELDDREIQRGGLSYTVDTLKQIQAEFPNEELFLIVGMDQFENFDQWHDYQQILSLVDLVVTSRPGVELAQSERAFPEGIRALVKKFSRSRAELLTGRRITFIQLEDMDVSATEIRRRLRDHREVIGLMPKPVENFVREQNLYERLSRQIGDFQHFTEQCAHWLKGKGALNIQGFDIRELSGPTEFTVVASGTSTRHTAALAEFLSREVKTQLGIYPQGVEGLQEGRWVVLDYGSLIVHLFYDYVRQEYRLEELWSKGKPLKLNLDAEPAVVSVNKSLFP